MTSPGRTYCPATASDWSSGTSSSKSANVARTDTATDVSTGSKSSRNRWFSFRLYIDRAANTTMTIGTKSHEYMRT